MGISVEDRTAREAPSGDASPEAMHGQMQTVDMATPATEILIPIRSRARRLLDVGLPPIVMFFVLIGGWAALIRWKNTPPYLAPSPGDVLRGFTDNPNELLTALRATAQDAFLGLGLSIVLGVAFAVVMSQSRLLERAVFPYATIAQTIPIFAIAPLIQELVGAGHTSIVLVALIIAIFPIIANTALGLSSVDHNQTNLFQMYNASRWQQLMRLRLPSSIPYMLTGIRVSSGLSVIGAIVGEVLLGTGGPEDGGLGFEIQITSSKAEWGQLGASALLTATLGIGVFLVLGALSNLALRNWHESAVQREN